MTFKPIATEEKQDQILAGIGGKNVIKEFEVYGQDLKAKDIVSFVSNKVAKADLCGIAVEGSETLEGDKGTWVEAVALSGKRVFLAYSQYVNGNGIARIVTVNDKTISYETSSVFSANSVSHVKLVKLSDTKVFIAYRDINVSRYGRCLIATITGDVITTGAPYTFDTYNYECLSAVFLSSTKVLLTFKNLVTGFGDAVVADIAGDVITMGASTVFTDFADIRGLVMEALSNSKALVVTSTNAHNAKKTVARVLNISGSTVTLGPEHFILDGEYARGMASALASTNKVFVAMYDPNNYVILDINEDIVTSTIRDATAAVAGLATFGDSGFAKLSDGHFALSTSSGFPLSLTDDDEVHIGNQFQASEATSKYVRIVPLEMQKAIIFYSRLAPYYIGAKVLVIKFATQKEDVGIVIDDASVGGKTRVLMQGFSDDFVDVLAGEKFLSKRTVGYGLTKNSIIVKPFWEL